MFTLVHHFSGLLYIHIISFLFFIIGGIVDSPPMRYKKNSTLDVVIATTTGMAITGFSLLTLGFIGYLNSYTLIVLPVAFWVINKTLWKENVISLAFLKKHLFIFFKHWNIYSLTIYGIFLILSLPSVLPPTLWDSISYHLAYAVDWANEGKIFVDEFLRFPYYANNFVLLYTLMFITNLGDYCHYLTWLCGLLTCLCIYGMVSHEISMDEFNDKSKKIFPHLSTLFLILSLVISPIFLRYLNVAYIDIPIGLFLLVPISCTYLYLRPSIHKNKYQLSLIITSAFCVGMKISNIAYLPLFAICSVIPSVTRVRKLSYSLKTLSALIILSCPWYLRNYIFIGDPTPPLLNLFVKRIKDPIFSISDYHLLNSDLARDLDLSFLIKIPLDFFSTPLSVNFREFGVTSVVLLLYTVLIIPIVLLFHRFRKFIGIRLIFINFCLIYLLFLWIKISPLGRYFLHVFPLYIVYLGIISNKLYKLIPVNPLTSYKNILANLLVYLALPSILIPSSSSSGYYTDLILHRYVNLSTRLDAGYNSFLNENLVGYSSSQKITQVASNKSKVLTIGFENLQFYFRKNRFISIGDVVGPARTSDLIDYVNSDKLADYLTMFNINSVLINMKRIGGIDYIKLSSQLHDSGFIKHESSEKETLIFIKN